MSFLTAVFLAGLLALGIPWWLHRREAGNQQRRPVSSLLLLRPGEAPLEVRRVLRHRLLLALRLLLLTVLVLAFAQPVLHTASAVTDPAAVLPRLIVVDTSASMQADFAAARRLANAVLNDLPPGVPAAVVGAARQLTVAAPPSGDRELLHGAVAALQPGHQRLDFDGLLRRLTTLAETLTGGAMDVHLISDVQQSAMPAQFNGLIAGGRAPLTIHPVPVPGANWLVERVTVPDGIRVVVRSLASFERRLEVVVSGAEGEIARRALTVGPDARASVDLPAPPAGAEDLWLRAAIEAGDPLPGDDSAFHVLRRESPVPLPLLVQRGGQRQAEYLRAAVAAAAPRFQPAGPAAQGPVAVLVDPGALPASRQRWLERHLREGGAVLITVGDATRRAGVLALTGQALESVRMPHQPRRVTAVDDTHPAIARVKAWRDVTVSQHLAATGAAAGSTILALDDGAPLLVEHRLGAGRMLVLMTALDSGWSTLVTEPAFVTLMADALGYLAEDVLPSAAVAGQPLPVPAGNFQLFDDRGRRLLALGDTVARQAIHLDAPGIYTLRTPSRASLLAVNVDPRESDLRPADRQLLERWQSASRLGQVTREAAAENVGASTRSLAPWLLGLLALLALLEPVAANLTRGGAPS